MRTGNEFWLCFVPLFVAVDPFGVLPIFMGLARGLDARAARRLIVQSALAALAALVFSAAPRINRLLGAAGAQVVSKIALLLLAAIAVMVVREGLGYFLSAAARTRRSCSPRSAVTIPATRWPRACTGRSTAGARTRSARRTPPA